MLLRSLFVYVLRQLFLSIAVNSGKIFTSILKLQFLTHMIARELGLSFSGILIFFFFSVFVKIFCNRN